MLRLLALLPLVVIAPAEAQAPPPALSVVVTPACCSITFTAYAFGLFPIDGRFGAFAGRLEIAPAAGLARAEARIETASLSLDGGPIEADVKAPHFLDVDRHPEIVFRATQEATVQDRLSGVLTIKGVTRPVALTVAQRSGSVTAEAAISRSAFGITARPLLAGDTVRITVSVPLSR